MIKNGVCPSDIPPYLLLKYCLADVVQTERLFHDQYNDMARAAPSLIPITFTRSITAPVLGDIEKAGLHLDFQRVEERYQAAVKECANLSAALDSLTGGINPNSAPQVREFVYGELGFEVDEKKGLTPSGLPSVAEGVLLSLNPTTEKQIEFLELRKQYARVTSALSKNLNLFRGACHENDCMLYATINQGRTATHRLSSSGIPMQFKMFGTKSYGCQFQNLPRAFKSLFSARDSEWDVWEVDGSQLEFRVAGHLGNDHKILTDVKEKADIHRYTASVINQIPEERVTKYQRTAAKSHTFKPLYGGTSGTEDEQRYYAAFAEKYAGIASTQAEWAAEVATTKALQTEWGMIYRWPNASVNNWGYLNVKTSVYNYPVQALATAEIIPIALVYLWHRTRDMDAFLTNTVHDSVVAEVPSYERLPFMRHSVEAFTTDVYRYLDSVYNVQFKVPLGVGIKMGKNWSESSYSDEELAAIVEDALGPEIPASIEDGDISIDIEVKNSE
jgi:DNA polymerase-1